MSDRTSLNGTAPPQRRRRVAEGQLSWQFPAGKVELGESCAEAAVRETKEEAGLDVVVVVRLGERVHPITSRQVSYTACGKARVAEESNPARPCIWRMSPGGSAHPRA